MRVDTHAVHRRADGVLMGGFLLLGKQEEHSGCLRVLFPGFLPHAVFGHHNVVHLGFD